MGAIFRLNHANIMAFVTSRSQGAPRVRRGDLIEFLEALTYDARRYLISEPAFESWPEEIAEVASRAASRLRETHDFGDRETLPGLVVERVLEELRSELSDYALFALAVGAGDRLRETAKQIASAPMYGQLLVLIPEQDMTDRNFEVLDPIAAFSVALHAAADWPGIVFWTANGASAFARLESVPELMRELENGMHEGRHRRGPFPGYRGSGGFDAVLRRWASNKPSNYRRLLHLSDLHFGTSDATENQPLLDAELRDIVKSVDRVVITGDLFDTPNQNYAAMFAGFKQNITHLAGGREPISITGNHDQRMIGLFGDNYKQVALIGSTKIVVDEQCQMVFICFNSSVKGSFARGKITQSQFRQIGAEYRTLTAARPELKDFLPIVLVHHHPFSFDVPPETWVQRALNVVGLRDEAFLEMVDAKDLHRWCLDWRVKTILHGHKHKARYVEREVECGSDRMPLTSIGCGSSLGAEGSPLSYNLLEWAPDSQRWIASFFESVNGGAFREVVASVSPEFANRR
ncbi:UDP-2,3-diacylglucosamine pyrophosphatase LpxH [Undibacterium sp. GrIS 1.8]|uniref:metallophosphoesterase family protein n=2 Tax=unclassified Undibacterium TaxID=2630295 RepID=UPI0033919CB7